MDKLLDSIKRHEGFRDHVYADSKGLPTIGYGHLIPGKTMEQAQAMFPAGCSEQQAAAWLGEDLAEAKEQAARLFSYLDSVRQAVLAELLFNMGPERVSGFRLMVSALERAEWGEAGIQLCDSRWWSDVKPRRGLHLATQLITGMNWQDFFSR